MSRVLAAEHIECAGRKFERLDLIIFATQQFDHAIIVWIFITAEIRTIDKVAAQFRRLQQKCGGEFAAIKMPVELFTIAVGHHIHAGQGIAHGEQGFLIHAGSQKHNERRPLINPCGN